MLTRERIALRVLEDAGGSLNKTVFVKIMFLLRMETVLNKHSSFYDFVPYKYGPHSFALYRDLYRLGSYGYVSEGSDYVALNEKLLDEAQYQTEKLATDLLHAVVKIVEQYGQMELSPLIKDVYERYRWYALNSERSERKLFQIPSRLTASPAVYTRGYEGTTVDAFFNYLLKKGIETIIDVRANPVSRKYGFSGSRMRQLGENVGIAYQHFPQLGISSSDRTTISGYRSIQRLFSRYEQHIRDHCVQEIREVGNYMQQTPSVLVCVEKDVECCHRSRLANAIAEETGMEIVNL